MSEPLHDLRGDLQPETPNILRGYSNFTKEYSGTNAETVWIVGLGSNLGSRRALLKMAIALLAAQPELTILDRSRLYYTPPLGPPQPHYLNAAVSLRSALPPLLLLDRLLSVEAQLGRVRREHCGPRTLDLDLLTGQAIAHPRLSVPHPRLLERPFAISPWLDLHPLSQAPELRAQMQRALLEAGGPPPSLGWEEGDPLDEADALVEAIALPSADRPPRGLRTQPLSLRGHDLEALRSALEAAAQTLQARGVALTELREGEAQALLLLSR